MIKQLRGIHTTEIVNGRPAGTSPKET
jgi:hypothetical protein